MKSIRKLKETSKASVSVPSYMDLSKSSAERWCAKVRVFEVFERKQEAGRLFKGQIYSGFRRQSKRTIRLDVSQRLPPRACTSP